MMNVKYVRSFILLGVAFIIAGVMNGSMSAVFNKAIRICLECIGIG